MLNIKKEVLHYLGYQNQQIDSLTDSMINSCINECAQIIRPFYTYKVFDSPLTNVLPISGEAIKSHLQNSKHVVVMAATLGIQIDSAINLYQRTDLTKALILNACATAAIEKECDKAQKEISAHLDLSSLGLRMNSRFSPGYGDLPLSLQPHLLQLLSADRKIGLIATEDFILIPRKSVTAIFGIFDHNQCPNNTKEHNCSLCNLTNCSFKRDYTS